MYVYFHFSSFFIMLLYILISFRVFVCSLFVMSLLSFVKLLVVRNSSIFLSYSSLYKITSVNINKNV
jgi:hypothetical protein